MPGTTLVVELEIKDLVTELLIKKDGFQLKYEYSVGLITLKEATLTQLTLSELKIAAEEFRRWVALLLKNYGAYVGPESAEEIRKGQVGSIATLSFVRNSTLTTLTVNVNDGTVLLSLPTPPVSFPVAAFVRTNYEL